MCIRRCRPCPLFALHTPTLQTLISPALPTHTLKLVQLLSNPTDTTVSHLLIGKPFRRVFAMHGPTIVPPLWYFPTKWWRKRCDLTIQISLKSNHCPTIVPPLAIYLLTNYYTSQFYNNRHVDCVVSCGTIRLPLTCKGNPASLVRSEMFGTSMPAYIGSYTDNDSFHLDMYSRTFDLAVDDSTPLKSTSKKMFPTVRYNVQNLRLGVNCFCRY